MTKPIDIAPAEAALAVIGIRPLLFGDIGRIYADDLHYMERIDREIIKRAKSCVNGEGEKIKTTRMDYPKMLKVLSEGITEEHLQDALTRFPARMQEVATVLALNARTIATALNQFIPKSEHQTLAGTVTLAPSDTRLWRFFATVEVLDDPLTVFDLMAAGALLRSQATAVRTVFPTMSAAIDGVLQRVIVDQKSKSKTWEVNPRAEYGIRAWGNVGPISDKLMTMVQSNAQELSAQKNLSDRMQGKPQSRIGETASFKATQPETATVPTLGG